MVRDVWTDYGGKGWWRWWSRLDVLLAMAIVMSLFIVSLPGASANPDAKRLYEDLLSNYNRLIRPVGNNSDRLTVKMGLRLSQLIDVVKLEESDHDDERMGGAGDSDRERESKRLGCMRKRS
ncbi:hypothetical protein PV327_005849 [Microctonus hyperodae]|uniref:Neurotransmitter-gated ion-channel ligand-binding domain-containing protein n=1 Tax=Microctonus hyperodae TaxID=165561 RepID=A0AA39G279_MICHY|nr:hypothetical protein PV327_005849 [Microctonus hyperodae]